jgi:hypothetical protein
MLSLVLVVNGKHLSYGQKTHLRWGVLIISGNTNPFYTVGRIRINIFGVVIAPKAMCGL